MQTSKHLKKTCSSLRHLGLEGITPATYFQIVQGKTPRRSVCVAVVSIRGEREKELKMRQNSKTLTLGEPG